MITVCRKDTLIPPWLTRTNQSETISRNKILSLKILHISDRISSYECVYTTEQKLACVQTFDFQANLLAIEENLYLAKTLMKRFGLGCWKDRQKDRQPDGWTEEQTDRKTYHWCQNRITFALHVSQKFRHPENVCITYLVVCAISLATFATFEKVCLCTTSCSHLVIINSFLGESSSQLLQIFTCHFLVKSEHIFQP